MNIELDMVRSQGDMTYDDVDVSPVWNAAMALGCGNSLLLDTNRAKT